MRKRLKRFNRWVWKFLDAVLIRSWRLWGRMGLALRNLLTWFIWQPLFFLSMPLWLPARWVWDFFKSIAPTLWRIIGHIGEAQQRMLTRFVWRPFRFLVIRPISWVYRTLLRPIGLWIGGHIRALAMRIWIATAPQRALYRRRWGSQWRVIRARWRVAIRRPQPPETAVIAPSQPRPGYAAKRAVRLATAIATVALIVVVGLINLQEQQSDLVAADNSALANGPITIVLTPTPLPPSPTPIPTVPVKLTPWVTPDPLQGGGTILFTQRIHGNSDIYVMPLGQAEPVRLTMHPAPDREAVWSPDGSQIAFASRRDGNWEIYIYDIPQGRLRRVTRNLAFDGGPTWSPDGQWLAYESYQDDNLDIYLVKADGSQGPFRLTRDPAPDYAPVWAPAGRHVAYVSWRTGNKDIFLQSLDDAAGIRVINVTTSPNAHEDNPTFSPDGRLLAYTENNAGFPLVYAQTLTADMAPVGKPDSLGQQGEHPAWSPDSHALVYIYTRNEQSFLMAGSPDAWGVVPQVFVSDGRLESPSWSAVNITPEMANRLHNIDRITEEAPVFTEAVTAPEPGKPPALLFRTSVNAPSSYLNDQVDESFAALRESVMTAAGWDFLGQLDGMFEPLDAKPLPGQSAQTWNKAGRAFDLYYRHALGFEPQIELARIDIGPETYWRVFVRAAVQDGSLGEPMRTLTWDFQARSGDDPQYYEQGGKWKESIPAGYYIDFTALAADFGWTWVPANDSWRTFFPDIRFWHYENRQGLTWEEAMRQLYTEEELAEAFGQQ